MMSFESFEETFESNSSCDLDPLLRREETGREEEVTWKSFRSEERSSEMNFRTSAGVRIFLNEGDKRLSNGLLEPACFYFFITFKVPDNRVKLGLAECKALENDSQESSSSQQVRTRLYSKLSVF
jgi:hypothetical protein